MQYKRNINIIIFTVLLLIFASNIFVTAEEELDCCETDSALVQELHNELLQKKSAELSQQYNPWNKEIQLFQIGIGTPYADLMPSTGDVKMLVLPIEFADCKFENNPCEDIKDAVFSEQDITDTTLIHENLSVSSFYKKASFNKLRLTGTVLPVYSASENWDYYYKFNDNGTHLLPQEIIKAIQSYKHIIGDLSEYDTNNDGCIDCLQVMTSTNIRGGIYTGNKQEIYDNVKLSSYSLLTKSPKASYGVAHEIGHLMGLLDNYYEDGKPSCVIPDWCNDLMTLSWGNYINAYYKYLLDWEEPIIFPYEDKTQEIEIYASDVYNENKIDKSRIIMFIPDTNELPFGELYMVEYRTQDDGYNVNPGVVIWHIDIEAMSYGNAGCSSSNYIKPVFKNGGEQFSGYLGYTKNDLYIKGDVWSSTTTPSSDFYNGYKTGAYMEVVSMDEEKATVRVGFQDMNWEQPTVSVTGKYHTDYRNVSFSLFYDDIYQIMGKRPTESQTKTEDLSKEIIDKYIEVSADNIPVQIDYSQCYLAQNKVYISVKDAEHDKIETNGSVIQLRLKEGSATNGFNKKCGTAFCEVKTPDLVPPTGTITYSTTEPTTESVTATLTSFSEEIQPIETMQHTFYRNGSYTFEFYDLAGNKGTATAIVDWIDREPVTAEVEYSTTELTNQDVTVKIIPSEPVLETEEELTFVFKSNGKKLFVYHDIYGNQFIKIVTVDWIDKKLLFKNLRSIDKAVRNVSGGSSSNNVKFDGSIISMIKPREKVKPAKLIQALTEDENEYIFELEDLAGNRETYRTLTNLLSKEASDGKIEYSSTEWTNEDVTVSIIPRYDVLDSSILTHRFEENGSSNYRIDLKSGDNISFTVNVGWIDKEAPIITLKGQSEIILECGEEYIEQGAEITDDQDMMIDDKLKISGTVDTSKAGTYTVTYNATDHAGNVAEQKVRTVTVLAPPPSPTPTATPSPTPSPSPTAEPTATPTASPTVKPTATPTATPTVKPTASPSPTPTTELTPTPTVTLSDRVEFERQADETILAKIIFEKTAPPKSEDLVLYIAYYRDNRLIKLEIPTITEMTAMFKIDEASQDCEIRAYVWDKEMQPLMEVQKMNK